jgi:hypothetical protein
MRTAAAASLTAVLFASLTACSLPGSEPATSPPAAEPPASAPAEPSGSAPAATAAGSPAASAPASTTSSPAAPSPASPDQSAGADQLGEVVATRTGSKDGSSIELQLHPVLRNGSTAHVNLVLTTDASKEDRIQLVGLFSDGDSRASDRTSWAADGIQLVDGKNAKLHLVASDGDGQCLCSRNLVATFLEAGAPLVISATFAAPAADVADVDVRIPGFGVVRGVPVQ